MSNTKNNEDFIISFQNCYLPVKNSKGEFGWYYQTRSGLLVFIKPISADDVNSLTKSLGDCNQ